MLSARNAEAKFCVQATVWKAIVSNIPVHAFALSAPERCFMFLILAVVLLILWAGGFFVFHAAGFLIHILLILAVVSLIFNFIRGRSV